jgi:hypothetical protein
MACRSLGFVQRLVLREHLSRVGPLLSDSESVQVMAAGWWRGHRCLVVVTASRLLLLRRQLRCSTANDAAISLRSIEGISVHAIPEGGARFRLAVGLDREEFSVTGPAAKVEGALRDSRT